MKQTAVIALLVLALIPAPALARDIEEGRFEISGSSQLNLNWSTEEEGQDTDTYSLNFEGQYYFIRNAAIGLFVLYEDVNVGSGDSTIWAIGPQATYNISYNDKLNLFGTIGLGMADYEVGNLDGDGFVFRIGGGVKYFLTQSVALVGAIRYQWVNLDENEISELNVNGGLSLFF